MLKSKKWALLAAVMIVGMILSACQPAAPATVIVRETQIVAGTSQVVEKVVTATPVPPTAPPPTAAPQASDTVVIAMQQEPDTLHPLIGSMMARTLVVNTFLVGCMGQNEKAEWIPLGCETVPTVDNGGAVFVGDGADKHLEITYKIRQDWNWQDGTPVTANDVIYAWKLLMDPDFEAADRTAIEKIYDISAVDDKTVLTKLMSEAQAHDAAAGKLTGSVDFAKYKDDYVANAYDTQNGPVVDPVYWLVGIAAGAGWMPEHILSKTPAKDQKAAEWSTKPVGEGPYVVQEWKQGQEIDLVANDKFPLGAPKVKNLIFRFYSDTAGVIAALQNGEIDIVAQTGGLTAANAPDLDKIEAAGAFKADYTQGYAWEHIDINTTKFPLDDVRVRQALYYAIDRQALVDKLYFGKQKTTDLPVPPGLSWAYTDDYTKYPFDLDKAKALLAEAGWDCKALPCVNADGKKLEFTLMTTDRADRQALAQVIQSQWKKLNVGANLQFLYGRGLFATGSAGGPLSSRSFDAAIFTWITGDDPDHMGLYNCAAIPTKENGWAGQNYTGFCDPKADEDLQNNALNPDVVVSHDKRKPYIADFYKLWTAQVPVIPLFSNATVTVARVGLKNWKPGPTQYSGETWNSWEWELSK